MPQRLKNPQAAPVENVHPKMLIHSREIHFPEKYHSKPDAYGGGCSAGPLSPKGLLFGHPSCQRVRIFRSRCQAGAPASSAPSGERNGTMNTIFAQQEPTLKELMASLTPDQRPAKAPTPRALRTKAGEPVAEIPGLRVYRNGYAVYENTSGRSVFRVTDCLSFTYCFQPARPGENSPVPDFFTIPREEMEALSWYIPLTLVGDYRVEYNTQVHRRELPLAPEDPDLLNQFFAPAAEETIPFAPGTGFGENPESALLRQENRREMLEALTGRQREVFKLYCFEGCNQHEIAERLGLCRSAVTRLLGRALDRVRDLL